MFVEGARTEELYFKYWHRRHRDHVSVTIDDRHGTPKQLVEQAALAKKQQRIETRKGEGRSYDEIWCVFDVDDHPRMLEALQQAADNEINVALSNPCFELWLILHYEDQTAFIERHQAQRRAEALLSCSKILSGHALDELAARYQEAVRRARSLDQKHCGDGSYPPHNNPSSQVWMLVDRIRDAGPPVPA